MTLPVSRPRFLELARYLALSFCTAVPGLVACTATPAPATSGASPTPTTPPAEPTGAQSATPGTGEPQKDPTAGSGPCRCSWDTNTSLAARVCRKKEIAVDGKACIPGLDHAGGGYTGEGGPMPMKGPHTPPDLPNV